MADSGPELTDHRRMMEELKRRLSCIKTALPLSRPLLYLDYPVYNNIGDLLIHQGAEAFFEDHGYDVLGCFSMHDFSRRAGAGERTIVLKPSVRDLDVLIGRTNAMLVFQGGGNFGDVWPEFQRFRELIIARYRGVPIVIFPQSIHFGSASERRRSAHLLAMHKRLFIFVRDEESLSFVRDDVGAEGEIVPDMAHQLWERPELASGDGGGGTLVQRRRDRESRGLMATAEDHFDWDELSRGASRLLLKALRKWQTIDNPLRHVVPNHWLWRPYRDHLVRRAVARFRPYDVIDTDRLHGMILGALMSKQVRYREGSYGKLHRYADRWLSGSPLIESECMRQAAE